MFSRLASPTALFLIRFARNAPRAAVTVGTSITAVAAVFVVSSCCDNRKAAIALPVSAAHLDSSTELEANVVIASLRPPSDIWRRVDEDVMKSEHFKGFVTNNAVHDTLMGEGMIETHEIYHCKETNELYCIFHFGKALNGHPGVVHGGILAMAFDNCFGWTFFAAQKSAGFTANLNVNYRYEVT